MTIRVNRKLLFGYAGTAMFFPFILIAKDAHFPELVIRHEKIHKEQIIECFIIGFYIIYAWEFIRGLIRIRNYKRAYFAIRFEREAYLHEDDKNYLRKRKDYAWTEL